MTRARALAAAVLCAALAGCGADAFHPCSSNRDCPVPQVCAGGLCVGSACGVGAPTCIDDGACGAGQHCAAGCCVAGASGSCARDADCSSLADTPVCNGATQRCVECVSARDCGPGRSCVSNACQGTPGCYTSSDCKDPARPLCNVVARACVECLQGSDCGDPARPNCDVSHTCVGNPKCTGDKDCKDPALPKCAPDGSCALCLVNGDCTGGLVCSPQRQCVPPSATTCVSDQDCASNPDGTHCKPGTATTPGKCVACVTDDQCPPGDWCAPDNTCQIKQCNADADCSANPATPKCLTSANPRVCVACLASGDCPNGGTCLADHTCQAPAPKCKSDADCAADVSSPHCKLVTGGANLCVACRLPGDCGTGQTCPNDCGPGQACNAANTCVLVACQKDADCTDPKKPHCLAGTGGADGTCVECTASAQCAAGQKCAANACVPICTAATEKTDCAAPIPRCKESPAGNACVQCLADGDCATGQKCSAQSTCITPPPPGCQSNADCPAGQHVCDTSQTPHACVQCLASTDCSNGDLCDTASKTCKPPPVGGEGQACKADGTCNTGLLCVDEGGASPVCRVICNPYGAGNPCSAAAAGTVCEWLGFDATKAFFGICEAKNGHGAAGAACDPTQVDSCEWNLICVPSSANTGACTAVCKPGSSCAGGSCNAIVGALDATGAALAFGWCGTTTTWGRACITDTGSAGPDCGSALSTAGTTGLFCTPSVLPAEVPAQNVAATCQYTPKLATAIGGAEDSCSAIGGNACRTGLCLSDGPATCFAGCQYNADCNRDVGVSSGHYCFDVSLFAGSASGTVGSCEPTCRDNLDCRSAAACAPQPDHGGNGWHAVCAPPTGAGTAGTQCTGSADCQSGVCVTAATLQSIGLGQAVSGFTATDGFCLGSCLPSQIGDCGGAGTACRIDAALPLVPLDTGDKGVAGKPQPGVCWGATCSTDANCAGASANAAVPRVCAPFKTTGMSSVDGAKKCTADTDCSGSTSWQALCNTTTNNPNPGSAYGTNAGIYGPNGRCRALSWAQHCAPSLIADQTKGGPGAACTYSTDCKTGHCVVSGTNKWCFGGCASDADCKNGTHCKADGYLGLAGQHCAP